MADEEIKEGEETPVEESEEEIVSPEGEEEVV